MPPEIPSNAAAPMTHLPDPHRFEELARSFRLVPVYRRLFADGLTPLSAFARIDAGDCGCLFESVVGGEKVGRYSFLGADPFMILEARGTTVTITREGTTETLATADPLDELRRRMEEFRPVRLPELPPFTSGVVGDAAPKHAALTAGSAQPWGHPKEEGWKLRLHRLVDRLAFDAAMGMLYVHAKQGGHGARGCQDASRFVQELRSLGSGRTQLGGPHSHRSPVTKDGA